MVASSASASSSNSSRFARASSSPRFIRSIKNCADIPADFFHRFISSRLEHGDYQLGRLEVEAFAIIIGLYQRSRRVASPRKVRARQ